MKYLFIFSAALLLSINCYAQGCSDAGFCSLGVLKNNVSDSAKHTISFGINDGLGEQGTNTVNTYIEYGAKLGSSFLFQTKVTSTYATGFLGSTFNIGDLYGTLNYAPKLNGNNTINFIGGVKLPLSTGDNKNKAGEPLSLDYQASIGTYDVIGGVNYITNKRWEFDAAIQLPVIQENKSTFFPDDFNDPRALEFAPTNNFRRRSDLLGRLGYYIRFPQTTFTLKPSLSAIYHLGNDSYENILGAWTVINDSHGLTLNGSIVATKKFKNANKIEVVAGTPFITRKVRPDGLTRSAVINVQYTVAF